MSADPLDRFNDLARQGFMKVRKKRRVKAELPIVACNDCMDWHRQGKHTADKSTRAANRAARKAKEI